MCQPMNREMAPFSIAQLLGIETTRLVNVAIVSDNAISMKTSVTMTKQKSRRDLVRQKSFESLHKMPSVPRRGVRRSGTPHAIALSPERKPIRNSDDIKSPLLIMAKRHQELACRWGDSRVATINTLLSPVTNTPPAHEFSRESSLVHNKMKQAADQTVRRPAVDLHKENVLLSGTVMVRHSLFDSSEEKFNAPPKRPVRVVD